MSADHREIVIVRRRSALEDEHHGGAWKIAFADFMTAMMAFFLVLWIISATDKNTKTIIARYFNPVKVEEPARSQKGIHGAEDLNAQTPGANSGARSGEKSRLDQDGTSGKSPAEAHEGTPADGRQRRQSDSRPPRSGQTHADHVGGRALQRSASQPRQDLRRSPSASGLASAALQGFGDAGPISDDSYRDPFRPLGQRQGEPSGRLRLTAQPCRARHRKRAEPHDCTIPAGRTPATPAEATTRRRGNSAAAQATHEAPKPGPAVRRVESRRPCPLSASAKSETAPTAGAFQAPTETARERAAALLADVKRRLGPETPSTPGPKLDVQATDEGILISLTDRQNFSMFAIGSAEPQPRVVHMMDAIATSLEATPGAIVVRGHTDARPYRSGPLRQLAPVLGARPDGLLHAESGGHSG